MNKSRSSDQDFFQAMRFASSALRSRFRFVTSAQCRLFALHANRLFRFTPPLPENQVTIGPLRT